MVASLSGAVPCVAATGRQTSAPALLATAKELVLRLSDLSRGWTSDGMAGPCMQGGSSGPSAPDCGNTPMPRQQAAADKLKQLEERRTAIDQYDRTAQAGLDEQRQHMSEKIRADIMAAVNAKAKAGGYAIVLNTAAEGISIGSANLSVPSSVIYSTGEIDLTADVLKQLNAGAPIDMTPASSAPVVLPVPSLLSTNGP